MYLGEQSWVHGYTQRQHISAVRTDPSVALIFLTEVAFLLLLCEVQCRKDDCLEGAAGRWSYVEFPQGSRSSFCEPSLCVCACVNGAELPLSVVCPCLPKEPSLWKGNREWEKKEGIYRLTGR